MNYYSFIQRTVIASTLTAGLLFSCSQSQTGDNVSTVSATVEKPEAKSVQLVIDEFTFKSNPIEGCSCYYSANEADYKAGKFIFASDYESNAYLSVFGTLEKLTLGNTDKTLPADQTRQIFVNDKCQVIFDVKKTGMVDESTQQKGTITIKPNGGKEVVKEIFGDCGC